MRSIPERLWALDLRGRPTLCVAVFLQGLRQAESPAQAIEDKTLWYDSDDKIDQNASAEE
jgi:hypothetical protein